MLVDELLQGLMTVLTAVGHLSRSDRQNPQDAGMAVRQRAVLQIRTMEVGQADQQVVALGPRQPRLPDGQAVLEIQAATGAVVGRHGQEISEAFVADRSGKDEFESVTVRLNRGPAT